jgi:hypothetical protein
VLVSVVGGSAAFRADYLIDNITQDEGTRLKGSTVNEWAGYTLSGGGGDVDGDGVADFVVGASSAGRAYVLYGVANASNTARAWPTDTAILSIAQDSTRGRIIDGAVMDMYLGRVVAIVGDVNGDRLDDIAIGAPSWSSSQGKVWLVWGKTKVEATNPLDVSTLNVSEFMEITGEAGSCFGDAIAGGDFNHDGFSDVLIGAPCYTSYTGHSYIVWGHNGAWLASINAMDIGVATEGI